MGRNRGAIVEVCGRRLRPAGMSPLDERIYPNLSDGNFTWHLRRYVWALPHAYGKRVLDVGCGSGYGTHLLSCVAESVVGVDYDVQAIQTCRESYRCSSNLHFALMNATALGLADESFDLIVSFEVFEHISHERCGSYLSHLHRVLRRGGKALLSTPNRLVEAPHMRSAQISNRYHVNSVSPSELRRRLHGYFSEVELLGQKPAETWAKRFLKSLDPFNLRHLLFSAASKERLDLFLQGGQLSYRPDMTRTEIDGRMIRQSSILLALCLK